MAHPFDDKFAMTKPAPHDDECICPSCTANDIADHRVLNIIGTRARAGQPICYCTRCCDQRNDPHRRLRDGALHPVEWEYPQEGLFCIDTTKSWYGMRSEGWDNRTMSVPTREADKAAAASAKRKATPIATGVLDYFPLAIEAVARLSKYGNDKHNPGEPLHWSRGKSSDHPDCIARHLKDRGKVDPESGELHDVALAWRALANLQLAEEKRLGLAPPETA